MTDTTGKIYFIYIICLLCLVKCQSGDTWEHRFEIEDYADHLDKLNTANGLDTFDLVSFERYLLQHPKSANGKTFKELYLSSDSFRIEERKRIGRTLLKDTLLFRTRNSLVPDPADPLKRNLLFKIYLHNVGSVPLKKIALSFPGALLQDSVWVDLPVYRDSLNLSVKDSVEIFSFPIPFINGTYSVGGTSMPHPLTVSQLSAPDFNVVDLVLVDRRKNNVQEIILPCKKLEAFFKSEANKALEFSIRKETAVYVTIPCLDKECLFITTSTGASVRREKTKDHRILLRVTPLDSAFTISVYSRCLPGYFIQSDSTKEKRSVAGENLVQVREFRVK